MHGGARADEAKNNDLIDFKKKHFLTKIRRSCNQERLLVNGGAATGDGQSSGERRRHGRDTAKLHNHARQKALPPLHCLVATTVPVH